MTRRFRYWLAGRVRALTPASILHTTQLHRILVRSPGPAPQEAGTQPRPSYIGSWYAGSWCAETCTKVARSNLDIKDPAGPSSPCPSRKKEKKTQYGRSLCGKSSATGRGFQAGCWKQDSGNTAGTREEKGGHVHAHQFPTGARLK